MIERYINDPHLRLKLLREALQLTQGQFAELLGVKKRTYGEWERKDRHISTTAERSFIKFNLNPGFLYGDNDMTLKNKSLIVIRTELSKLKGSYK